MGNSIMDSITNEDRAERGAKCLEFYASIQSDWAEEDMDGNVSALGDLIADLLHLAATWPTEDGMSPAPERVLMMAQAHFEEETEEEEDDDDDDE